MDSFADFWRFAKTVAGALLLVLTSLYCIRCAMTFSIISIDSFDHYVRGLLHYIVG